MNRAKRSLAVDLKTDEGVAIVQRLARDCDVFLQNYRVGKIDRFGLDYAAVKKSNPEVIYVPTYNPTVVYGAWPYAAYPPYSYYPPGYAAGAAFFEQM